MLLQRAGRFDREPVLPEQPFPLRAIGDGELRDVPPVLGHIVERCLKKSPADRYRTGLDLAGDLSLVFSHIRLLEDEVPGEDKFAMVRDLRFFQDFSDNEVYEVINSSGWHEYAPGDDIIVEFIGVDLPERLSRRLHLVDFATPVRIVDTKQDGDNVRMIIEAANYEAAVEIARTCPHLLHNRSLEVRRIDDMEGD